MTNRRRAFQSILFSVVGLWFAGIGAANGIPEQAAPTLAAQAPQRLSAAQLLPKTRSIYPTQSMDSALAGEDTRIVDHGRLIHYMTPAERERSRVIIVKGLLYGSNGLPTSYGKDGEQLNYVMDAAGNFFLFDQTGHPDLRHSSFFGGAPVACAGDLQVQNGRIVKIDRDSGHYHSTPEMFARVSSELKKDGVDLPHTVSVLLEVCSCV